MLQTPLKARLEGAVGRSAKHEHAIESMTRRWEQFIAMYGHGGQEQFTCFMYTSQ